MCLTITLFQDEVKEKEDEKEKEKDKKEKEKEKEEKKPEPTSEIITNPARVMKQQVSGYTLYSKNTLCNSLSYLNTFFLQPFSIPAT